MDTTNNSVCCKNLMDNIITPFKGFIAHFQILKILVIKNNNIKRLADFSFISQSLKYLNLAENSIRRIDKFTFTGADNLFYLNLAGNKIKFIHSHALPPLTNLDSLNLQNNNLGPTFTVTLPENLTTLYVQSNKLKHFKPEYIGENNLQIIYMENNCMNELIKGSIFSNIIDLNLQNNKIGLLDDDSFANFTSLEHLTLTDNKQLVITPKLFAPLTKLRILDLEGISIANIQVMMFSNLHLQRIKFSKFAYCQYVPHVPNCYPKTDGISSLKDLLALVVLRVFIWAVGLFTIMANSLVFVSRLRSRDKNKTSAFIINLCVSDLIMGIYLIMIAIYDTRFRGVYNKHSLDWKRSRECQLIGSLSVTSALVRFSLAFSLLKALKNLSCGFIPQYGLSLRKNKRESCCCFILN
ncbi:DgyrCDS8555 [Dimorphilus gyrociliatus]|uniref:DgyrCDS8555 n=1 Tax=Dimorphilus gyrociliatus TaxID=2664684 RepID=A0A7I8VUF9_9ANNE|nr:DgyrCDS8555 [Dimorphilus gyrociliatus]